MATDTQLIVPERPEKFTFARHETFHLRQGWLFKGLNALSADPLALYAPDSHHQLGVGINMLRSILYWVQATDLVRPATDGPKFRRPLELTRVGGLVKTHDPYLEDLVTQWIIHLQLASNMSLATFWYWVFNEFAGREFTEDRLVDGMSRYISERGASSVNITSLKKDARCFLRTYLGSGSVKKAAEIEDNLDSSLAHLALIREIAIPNVYKIQVGPRPDLPLPVFAYTLLRFRETMRSDQEVLNLEEFRWAPLSPGRLLCLDTDSILEFVESLHQGHQYIRLTRTAGLNTVTVERDVRSFDLLADYYGIEGHHV